MKNEREKIRERLIDESQGNGALTTVKCKMGPFHFFPAKVAPCPDGLSKAALRAGCPGKNRPRFACGIFPRQALHNPGPGTKKPVRNKMPVVNPAMSNK